MPLAAGAAGRRLLYVAEPGIRNYVEYGGVGVLVFDVDASYEFVRRIPTWDVRRARSPRTSRASPRARATGRLYVTTLRRIACFDLAHGSPAVGQAARGRLRPPGHLAGWQALFVPSFEGPHWNVLDAATGETIGEDRHEFRRAQHDLCADGRRVYLAGLQSPLLSIADPASNQVVKTIGPFSNSIRPFTVNAAQTRCYVNVNELLGFEVGDITTGKKLHRVVVQGVSARARQAARLSEPRDRADAGRARAVGVRRAQPGRARLRRDGRSAGAEVVDRGPRSTWLDFVQHRRAAGVSIHGRGLRREDEEASGRPH